MNRPPLAFERRRSQATFSVDRREFIVEIIKRSEGFAALVTAPDILGGFANTVTNMTAPISQLAAHNA